MACPHHVERHSQDNSGVTLRNRSGVTDSYLIPASTDEAAQILADGAPHAVTLGGGTMVMALFADGTAPFNTVIDLSRIGLDRIDTADGGVRIGAMVTLDGLARHPQMAFLSAAARSIGGPAIRNLATVGGNVAACGDLAVALSALGAEIELRRGRERATIAVEDWRPDIGEGALIVSVTLPRAPRSLGFCKLARRRHASQAVVTAAVHCISDSRLRVAAGGFHLPPSVVEAADLAAAGEALAQIFEPVSDAIASAAYRHRMLPVALSAAHALANGEPASE
jgi:CO/xanthine dehydrogenase FAD-binding subunit